MTQEATDSTDRGSTGARPRWFSRHPVLSLLALNLALLVGVAALAEIALRLYVPYNPGYYTGVAGRGREVIYPYGVIKINSAGFADDEFDLSRPHKVGYFGDSVTYGVGAGHGYRVSDLLRAAHPAYEHMNLGGIGLSLGDAEIRWATDLAVKYALERAVYLFNLNDILPDQQASAGGPQPGLVTLRTRLLDSLDWLRGRSYLYTAVRSKAKNALEGLGYGFHGYTAYELFPERHAEAIRQTAGRIDRFASALGEHGISLAVVILPYEMQISREAELEYEKDGIDWGPGFVGGETQRVLKESLAPGLAVYDAYYAFVDPDAVEASRARNGLGEYFVFDQGDKLDWNHPNRAGHRKIADYLVAKELLPAAAEAARPEP